MIELKNVTVSFQNDAGNAVYVLENIDLTISKGEAIAIMGPNGSGKTTLVRCLNALLLPTTGSVIIDGLRSDDAKNLLAIRKKVGLIFQNPENQIVSTSVEREIAFGLENIGVPVAEMQRLVDEMLVRFDLINYRKFPPYLLSGGEKQRLAIASVMAMRPEYLILDEPTSLLDPVHRDMILSFIRELHTASNNSLATKMTTILITQFPEEAIQADRLIIMNEGKIVRDNKPSELFKDVTFFQQIGLQVPIEFEIEYLLKQRGIDNTEIESIFRQVQYSNEIGNLRS